MVSRKKQQNSQEIVDFSTQRARAEKQHAQLAVLHDIIAYARTKGIEAHQLKNLLIETPRTELPTHIPISIFSQDTLSCLEATITYLSDLQLTNRQIAHALGRSDQMIWYTLRNARRKHPHALPITDGPGIPLSIFKASPLSFLETITNYLRSRGLRYHDIALMLKRDERTIWTAHARAQRKIRNTRHTHNAQNTHHPVVGP